MTSATPTLPVAGRTCGDCAMCCKIPEIPELQKPYNTWCQNCADYSRCEIYDTRPQRCRDFFCRFMLSATMGEEWRPSKCRLMVTTYPDRIVVMVDPARPDAWRKEPYLTGIRHWATQTIVYVKVAQTTYAVFPDHVDDLGEVTDDHQILILEEQTLQGTRRRAQRVLKSQMEAQTHEVHP